MIIQSSAVCMSGSRSYVSKNGESTSGLIYWGTPDGTQDRRVLKDAMQDAGVSEEETKEIKNKLESTKDLRASLEKKTIHQIKQEVIDYLFELFFGDGEIEDKALEQLNNSGQTFTQEFGGIYTRSNFFYEKETTSFQTKGTVVTADGREMTFHVDVEMSRSFASYVSKTVNFGAERVCDPLVINLDSNVTSVSDQKFFFDIDADGVKDYISGLSKGSGFLALDKNNNGSIDNGLELFGAKSGDGFADLEEYDLDKNGWIDEADAVFDMLTIWTKDENGNNKLIRLKEAGIGAICLQNADTQFSLNSRFENRTNAYIRKTGIFLYENGESGTIQHLDLVQ